MKRILMIAAVLLAAGTASLAQSESGAAGRWSVTPHVGANLWTARYVVNADEVEKGGTRVGLTAGAELGCQLVPRVSVSLGADYTLQRFSAVSHTYGYYYPYDDRSYTVATGRLCLPLLVGVRLWQGLSVRTGLQMGLGLHSNTAKVKATASYPNDDGGTIKYKFDPVHWYLPVGLSYEYRRWVADLRYCCSLKKNHWECESKRERAGIFGVDEYRSDKHDQMLQLTLGYRFQL